jgi:potassium-dependent mechanosensitive channel
MPDHPTRRLLPSALLAVLALLSPLPAQIPSIPGITTGTPEAKSTSSPEDAAKRLDDWHRQATESLPKLEGPAPEGISPAEVSRRIRDAEQLLFGITLIRKENEALATARNATEQAKAQADAWAGFGSEPPYSILMLDDLESDRSAKNSKRILLESSLATLELTRNTSLEEARTADAAVDRAIHNVQSAPADQEDAAKWRLEAARLNSRLQAVRSLIIQARCETVREQITHMRAEVEFADRRIATMKPHAEFLESDMEKLGKIISEREAALQKEIESVTSRINSALSRRKKIQQDLDRMTAADTPAEELEIQNIRLATIDLILESLRAVREGSEGLLQVGKASLAAQQSRWDFLKEGGEESKLRFLDDMQRQAQRFRDWSNLIKIELETVETDISNIEARKKSTAADDPRSSLYDQQYSAKKEEMDMMQRVSTEVEKQRSTLRRWISQLTPQEEEENAQPSLFKKIGQVVTTIWNFELMTFENRVNIDGENLVGKFPVSVAMLTKALLLIIIGYGLASRIANRIRMGFVNRGHIGEAQSKTLSNWAMIVVGFILLLVSFSILKIPLTMFAFLGGALAIGIGFGTQTLIKNFISGIILLVERKIRVGDIVDVEGIVGRVTEVSTRSSIIKSPDDVETMIPNSLFLEHKVTNWTLTMPRQRKMVRVGVAYGSDTRLVMDILKDCALRHGLVCKDPEPFAIFEDFGDSALVFALYYWYDFSSDGNALVVASDLRLMIEKRLREAGIEIPFPQRTIHLASKPIRVEMTSQDHE